MASALTPPPIGALEEIYDPGRMQWLDLLERSKQATRKRDRDRLIIDFADDLQHHEISRYLAALPQTVKTERRGKKLIVENPRDFDHWLTGQRDGNRTWLSRLFRG